jgi:hypothetical protein
MRAWSHLPALALGLFFGAEPASACVAGYQTYFSYSRLEPVGGTVNIRVRITQIRGRVILAELDGPFASLSNDGNVRILLPREPDGFGCEWLGPTQGRVFVTGTPFRAAAGTLTFEAVSSRPVRFRRVRSLDHYERYIVDPAYLTPEERRRREERQ